MKRIGIIPARGNSKSIPNKNIIPINGIPLIAYTIDAARKSVLDEVIVSTDSSKIKEISEKYGAIVLDRPPELSSDDSPTEPVIEHVLDNFQCDEFALLQPTSPLRTYKDINASMNILSLGYDLVIAVTHFHGVIWDTTTQTLLTIDPNNRPRRQDSTQIIENGSIYAMKKSYFTKANKILNTKTPKNIAFYYMPKERSFQIDDYIDLNIVSSVIS